MKKTLLLSLLFATTAVQAQVTFTEPVAYRFNAQAVKALAVDINNDRYVDIVVAGGAANAVVVLLNDQAGGFQPAQLYATGAYCSGVAVTAMNCDANADLLVTTANDSQVQAFYGSLPGTVAGTFSPGANFPGPDESSDVLAADYNGDGRPDFAVAGLRTGQVSVFLNTSSSATCTSTFAPGVSYASQSGIFSASMLKSVDLNRDGKPDVVVVNTANPERNGLSALFSAGTGTLSAPTLYNTGTAFVSDVAFVPLDADNVEDVVLADPDNKSLEVLLGSTSAPFLGARSSYAVSDAPLGVTAADFNQDGKRDVATVLSNSKVELLLGTGTGTLGTPVTVGTGLNGTRILAADFNNDGSQDIAVVGSGAVSVLLNRATVLSKRPATAARALSVYPNPSTGTFQLAAGGDLQVFDLAGRSIEFQRTNTSVRLPGATPGVYFLELTTATERRRQTLLIQ